MVDEFRTETETSRAEAAAYLRQFADELEKGGRVVVLAGDRSRTINPPDTLQFRVHTATDSSWLGGDDGQTLSFELGWNVDEVPQEDDLVIVSDPDSGKEDVAQRAREIREERLEDPDDAGDADQDPLTSEGQ